MFERYTERARRVIFFGRYEASQFGSTIIETEHLLLGLVREDKNLTNRFLRDSSSIENIRKEIQERVEVREKVSTSIDLPLSPACKRILAYANEEAERLNHRHIGTEHLLLGILREETCLAAELLRERGLRVEAIREELAHGIPDQSVSHPGDAPTITASLFNPNILGMLGAHGFTVPLEHFSKAALAGQGQDWPTAHSQLQIFLESLAGAIKDRSSETVPEDLGWQNAFAGFRTGLSNDEDWGFRLRLALLLAQVLVKRYEQRLNS